MQKSTVELWGHQKHLDPNCISTIKRNRDPVHWLSLQCSVGNGWIVNGGRWRLHVNRPHNLAATCLPKYPTTWSYYGTQVLLCSVLLPAHVNIGHTPCQTWVLHCMHEMYIVQYLFHANRPHTPSALLPSLLRSYYTQVLVLGYTTLLLNAYINRPHTHSTLLNTLGLSLQFMYNTQQAAFIHHSSHANKMVPLCFACFTWYM